MNRIRNSATIRWLRLFAVAATLLLTANLVHAQPTPRADGGPLPDFVIQNMQRDPTAYRFANAWIAQTRLLKRNRELLNRRALNIAGLSPDQIRSITTVTGTKRVPIFLGKFSDTGAAPITQASLSQELFDGPWPTGTMTEYYDEISYGLLDLQGTVYDWVTTSFEGDFYAGGTSGLDPPYARTGAFITEILEIKDPAVDFGQFDNDGPDNIPNSGDDDGYVDFVAIVQPRIGQECFDSSDGNNIWSHRWQLQAWPSGPFVTDDMAAIGGHIIVNDYVIMPALGCDGGQIEIGVFCHEFGHGFGLPDLYDTDQDGSGCTGDASEGIGYWGLMGLGPWNTPERPAHMSAWAKAELGWLNPGVVANNLFGWSILSASTTPTAFKLWTYGTPGSEYFLVEYRTQDGFDDQLLQEGLLIWHVDDGIGSFSLNNVNRNECHPRVDLECADQTGLDHTLDADDLAGNVNNGDMGDPFCDGDVFDGASVPSSVAYNDVQTSVAVRNISGCGNLQVIADLIVGQDPGINVDLCMRDCGADVCTEPSPCDKFWASPAVYIDNNEDGIIDPPADGLENKLFARVRNVGTTRASSVDVDFYYTDPAMGVMFPSNGTLIGSDNVPLIESTSSEVAEVTWLIPAPPPSVNHFCIGVVATNSEDGQTSELARDDNNVAQINLQELYAKAGDAVPLKPGWVGESVAAADSFQASQVVRACNPSPLTCPMQVVMGSPPNYDDVIIPPGWNVTISPANLVLGPGQCSNVVVDMSSDSAVHTDRCEIPLTLLCAGNVIGGTVLTVEIDNVEPQFPCGFSVTKKPIEGDHNPAAGHVVIEVEDSFMDVLGFPERVERWKAYRGDDPAFVPAPGNLIVESCIDADPSTVAYEFFVDPPTDPTHRWYKIVAEDRAGNQSAVCVTEIEDTPVGIDLPTTQPLPILAQNHPNPFSVGTSIQFHVPAAGEVSLTVFRADGRLVRKILDRTWLEAGDYRKVWDGRDVLGHEVPTGIYFYQLIQGRARSTGRMIRFR